MNYIPCTSKERYYDRGNLHPNDIFVNLRFGSNLQRNHYITETKSSVVISWGSQSLIQTKFVGRFRSEKP